MYQRPASTATQVKNGKPGIFSGADTHDLDQYYTKPEVVDACLTKLGSLSDFDCVIEPSAGDGAFHSKIKHTNLIGLDIAPKHPTISKADWLEYQISDSYKKVAIVGNPPFGRFNNLSSAFIKHALQFPNVTRIGFILPDVYNKHTRQAILPEHWRIKTIYKLPRDAFLYEGEDRHVPCSFFVFCQSPGKDLRTPTTLPTITDFSFSTIHDYDVFVFGGAPKKYCEAVR